MMALILQAQHAQHFMDFLHTVHVQNWALLLFCINCQQNPHFVLWRTF